MASEAQIAYAELCLKDEVLPHPSGAIDLSLERARIVGILDDWAAAHDQGAVHLRRLRNMSTSEMVFQVLLTARDSLDLESGWFATADEARAAMVEGLEPLEEP